MAGDSVGGFYASLKLNIDKASFQAGIGLLKELRREADALNKSNGKFGGGPGGGRGNRGSGGNNSLATIGGSKALSLWKGGGNSQIRLFDFNYKKLGNQEDALFKQKKQQSDEMSTSTKWMIGAAFAATAAFMKLADSIGKSWETRQVLGTTSRNLRYDPVWLNRWERATVQAGGNSTDFDQVGKTMSDLLANPSMGKADTELMTKLFGILNMTSGSPDMNYQELRNRFNRNPQSVVEPLIKAMQKGYDSKDNATHTNVLSIGEAFGPFFERMLGYLGPKDSTGHRNRGAFGAYTDVGAGIEDAQDLQNASDAAAAAKKTGSRLMSAWNLFADNMGLYFTPFFEHFNEWFDRNSKAIKALAKGDILGFEGASLADQGKSDAAKVAGDPLGHPVEAFGSWFNSTLGAYIDQIQSATKYGQTGAAQAGTDLKNFLAQNFTFTFKGLPAGVSVDVKRTQKVEQTQ
jgi:hypothetical protein